MSESFFTSRWVDRPANTELIDANVLPAGFRAAGVAAGLKPSGKPDVAVLVSDEPATVSAARFTTNALVGAPVAVSQAQQLDALRAIVANSGGANVGDGARGLATAEASRDTAAQLLGVDAEQVGLASTGGVALELPRELLLGGIASAAAVLAPDALDFSTAILTTDSGPKRVSLEVALSGGTVLLSAQAKGAGMISPRFATMFCFVETDADLDAETVELLTGVTVRRSFDRISVDGQLSTSDTVYVLANGASGVRVEPESADELTLGQALDSVMRQLAVMIVHDGEGADRAGRVVVRGDAGLVEPVARAIADSPLVKAALNGGDPNFGRIAQAAGQAMSGTHFAVDIAVEGIQVMSAGAEVPLSDAERAALQGAIQATEIEFDLTIPGEGGETEVFFSDLSQAYVSANADYTT